ncbi:MAG TPA: MFS transporter [Streptosporangiaceae bacterium]|nr:MFS transporter [Streptosporangiaceae bacterium]
MAVALSVDARLLGHSRDLRLLMGGRAISELGNAIAAVGAAVQAYRMTHSSIAVGVLGMAAAVPMVTGMLAGGAIADAMDRRMIIVATQAATGLVVAGLALNAASGHPQLWLLFLLAAASGAAAGLGAPARWAAVPALVPADQLPAAAALNATVSKAAGLAGPAIAGLIIARLGVAAAFSADAASYLIYALMAARLRPLLPRGGGRRAGLGSFAEGLGYLRHDRLVAGLLIVDVTAMVFGMPSALFPAIATGRFHGGAATVGLLYAAPAAGGLAGALTSGWIGRVRHAGRVLLVSALVWGLAICGFGLAPVLPVALAWLALAGAGDLVSEVLRSSLLQLSIPDGLRGRLSALWLAQANAAPALGNLEAGGVAAISTPAISVVSGGLACVLGVALLAVLCPAPRRARLWERNGHDDNGGPRAGATDVAPTGAGARGVLVRA